MTQSFGGPGGEGPALPIADLRALLGPRAHLTGPEADLTLSAETVRLLVDVLAEYDRLRAIEVRAHDVERAGTVNGQAAARYILTGQLS